MTWASHTHSPAAAMIAYSMANSKHKHGECMGREQSRIGIIIRLFKNGRISFPSFPQSAYCGGNPFSPSHKVSCLSVGERMASLSECS